MDVAEPIAFSGTPVEYKWETGSSTTLAEDAERYEKEFTELYESDESTWATVPVKKGKLFMRPVTNVSTPAPVSKYVIELDSASKDAKDLFKFLVTIDGFKIIDKYSQIENTRSSPSETFTYKGIEGYTSACVSTFKVMGNLAMVCPNAVWFDDSMLLTFMCPVPVELRSEEAKAVDKDYHIAHALKCTDVSPGIVRVEQLLMVDCLTGALGEAAHKAFFEGFAGRLAEYLATEAES